jgi:predicted phosphodiesterase
MKIAVLSDIHSNLQALQAIIQDMETWDPDITVVAGDVLNRGPRPRECLDIVLQYQSDKNWVILQGNHEEYVLNQARWESQKIKTEFMVHRASIWTFEQVRSKRKILANLPSFHSIEFPPSAEVRFAHASMRGNRDGIYQGTSDSTLTRQIGIPPAVFCVGHTHIPLIRRLNGTLIVNAGSAGLPFDGDHRPAYARVTLINGIWRAHIERVAYDLEKAKMDYFQTGYLNEAGPLAQIVLCELVRAQSLLYHWSIKYQKAVMEGVISMDESAKAFLSLV